MLKRILNVTYQVSNPALSPRRMASHLGYQQTYEGVVDPRLAKAISNPGSFTDARAACGHRLHHCISVHGRRVPH